MIVAGGEAIDVVVCGGREAATSWFSRTDIALGNGFGTARVWREAGTESLCLHEESHDRWDHIKA